MTYYPDLSPCAYAAPEPGVVNVGWLDKCRLPATGWAGRVRGAVEEPWMFLSGSLDRLVIVTEAEYLFECYAASA